MAAHPIPHCAVQLLSVSQAVGFGGEARVVAEVVASHHLAVHLEGRRGAWVAGDRDEVPLAGLAHR